MRVNYFLIHEILPNITMPFSLGKHKNKCFVKLDLPVAWRVKVGMDLKSKQVTEESRDGCWRPGASETHRGLKDESERCGGGRTVIISFSMN